MAQKGNSAIWRDGAEPTTEVGTEDIIQFNDDALVNNRGYIVNTGFQIKAGIARNERPGAVDKRQDTGLSSVVITVTGSIQEPANAGEGLDPAHTFKAWMIEDKTVVTTFPKGRFGLRLDDFPAFNMTPTTTKGYMLQDVQFTRDGETKGKLSFIATLVFNGAVGSPTSGEYLW